MNETETGTVTGGDAERGEASTGQRYVSKTTQSLRQAAESGTLAGFSGGVGLVWGVLTLGRGNRERGLARLLLGGSLLAVGIGQRRGSGEGGGERSDVDQTDVVGGSASLEDVASPGDNDDRERASGDEAQDIVGGSADIENAGSGPELDSDVEGTNVDQSDVAGSSIDDATAEPDE